MKAKAINDFRPVDEELCKFCFSVCELTIIFKYVALLIVIFSAICTLSTC